MLDPPSRTTTFWGGVLDPPLPNYYLLGGGRGVSLEGRPPPASEVPLTPTRGGGALGGRCARRVRGAGPAEVRGRRAARPHCE